MGRTITCFNELKRKLHFLAGLLAVFLVSFPAFSAVEHDLLPASDSSGRWGYGDARTKKTVIAPRYGKAGFFDNGVAIVTSDARHKGLIDRTGREILPVQYDAVERARLSYSPYKALPGFFLVSQGGLKGVVQNNGNWVLPLEKYDNITFYKEGCFRFDGSFWIDGKTYHPPSGYAITRIIRDADAFMIESTSRSAFSMPKKGVMLFSGEILIKPEYDSRNLFLVSEFGEEYRIRN